MPYQGFLFGAMIAVAVGTTLYYLLTGLHEAHDTHNQYRYEPPPTTNSWSHDNSDLRQRRSQRSQQPEECSICYNEVDYNKRTLRCGHSFCTKCINKWLNENRSCPNCRKPV